jgi:hypothetical protein
VRNKTPNILREIILKLYNFAELQAKTCCEINQIKIAFNKTISFLNISIRQQTACAEDGPVLKENLCLKNVYRTAGSSRNTKTNTVQKERQKFKDFINEVEKSHQPGKYFKCFINISDKYLVQADSATAFNVKRNRLRDGTKPSSTDFKNFCFRMYVLAYVTCN